MLNTKDGVLLTKEGFKQLEEELQMREGEIKEKLQDTLNQMRDQGDLKENDGYSIAVEEFQNNEERILEIKDILKKAEIVNKKHANIVEVGSKVTIEDDNGKQQTYNIVGSNEANPLEKKISYDSPMGSSLMGKKKGSHTLIDLPSGKVSYKIVDIE